MLLLRDDRKIYENTGKYGKAQKTLIFLFFSRVLRPGRHPRGFPELVGSILYEYEPERSHMDLFRIHFHDFPPKSGILQPAQPMYGYIKIVQIVEYQIGRKIMNMDPKQVHMAPFGLIFIQDGSHKLWEASGMPPGP